MKVHFRVINFHAKQVVIQVVCFDSSHHLALLLSSWPNPILSNSIQCNAMQSHPIPSNPIKSPFSVLISPYVGFEEALFRTIVVMHVVD